MTPGLLAPWNLLAALAVAVPVVIHLIRRRREAVLDFPTVRFLLLAHRRSARRLRLRRLLLLLLRSLVIVVLALLLARPVLYAPGAAPGEAAGAATAVVLDNSLSMAARGPRGPRFEEARALAAALASGAGEGAGFALIAAAGGAAGDDNAGWTGPEPFLRAVAAAAVRPAVADFTGAFARAYRLLRERGAGRARIVVITDLARGGWERFSAAGVETLDPAVPVRILHLGGKVANRAGILRLSAQGESAVAGEARQLVAEVANYGPERVLALELWVDGALAGRRLETIAPGGMGRVSFEVRPQEEGSHRAEVRLAPDGYPEDDRRLAGLQALPPVRVLIADGEPGPSLVRSETFFLQEALRPERLAAVSPLRTVVISPEGLEGADLDAVDVLVLANVKAPSAAAAARITRFVERGGGLALWWGRNCDAVAYARAFGGLLPVAVAGSAAAPEGRAWRVGEVDYGAEALEVFRPPGGGSLATAAFRERAAATAAPGAAVLARFEDGVPFLAAQAVGRGRVLFAGSSADLEWNDLATKPVYVPLQQRTVLWLCGRLGAAVDEDLEAWQEKSFPGRAEEAFTRVALELPGGARREAEFLPGTGGVRAVFRETSEVGFYLWTAGSRRGIFAVNGPAAESDLSPLAAEEVLDRFRPARPELVAVGPEAAGEAATPGMRRLARPLLLLLLALLAVESLVAGPRRFRPLREGAVPRRAA